MQLKHVKIEENVALAPLTTFKIGGEAKYFAEIKTAEALEEVIAWAKVENLPIFILGGGSNLLISDEGFAGLVLKINNKDSIVTDTEILAGAGLALSELVALASNNSLSGLEWAVGIPGTVGGAVCGNAGAYGSEMKNNVEFVKVFDIEKEEWLNYQNSTCDFSYRSSFFKEHKKFIIWEIRFSLIKGETEEIKETMKNIIKLRTGKIPTEASAGSIFKNLLTTNLDFELCEVYKDKIRNGKLASGLLIEDLGFKGFVKGGAQVSEKHANIIINKNQATAKDVLSLIANIKEKVKEKYNIELEVEVEMVNC